MLRFIGGLTDRDDLIQVKFRVMLPRTQMLRGPRMQTDFPEGHLPRFVFHDPTKKQPSSWNFTPRFIFLVLVFNL